MTKPVRPPKAGPVLGLEICGDQSKISALQVFACRSWSARMAHAYKVGQLVEYTPGRTGMPASTQKYEIVRQMPPEGGENQYRIKCKSETYERVARESELKRRI